MHLQPILSALRRNKAGAILIGMQIALTLAIVCNALFIIVQRLDYIGRPTGVDEANVMAISNLWVNHPNEDAKTLGPADLETIRQTPGVVDAYRTNSFPLRGGGWSTGITLTPQKIKSTAQSTVYFADEHAINSLGTHLIAGRNFTPDEIGDFAQQDRLQPPVVIVTEALGKKLFPDGTALGKSIYMGGEKSPPSVIIGIVDMLQTPWVGNAWSNKFFLNAMLVPEHMLSNRNIFFIRAQPGQREAVLKAVQDRLYTADRMRIIRNVRSFDQVRADAYKKDRGMAVLMGIVCAALLVVTAAGIVGLASFWVGQRHRQIGIRRALGARKGDILRYFLIENLMITSGGVVVGAALAIGLNLWLVTHYEMSRLSVLYVAVGAVLLLGLGQASVLSPALRASRVPPLVATRAA